MSDHAPLPPSGAEQWEYCHGGRAMCAQFPEPPDSPTAADGTAAHWVFAELLAGRPVVLGQIAPNGVPITDEMLDGAELFVETVDQLLPAATCVRQVEQRVVAPDAVHPANWGTPDVYGWNGGTLHIVDYKFGHRYIDVFENWQLINYACLILEAAGINGLDEQYITVQFTIVQPRSYTVDGPVRSWSCSASDLRPYRNKLRMAAEIAMQPDAPLRVSLSCRDCSARHACPALQAAGMAAADESYRPAPMELPPAALGLELRIIRQAIERLTARESGLDTQAAEIIRRGGIVPGFRIERSAGRLKWNKPLVEVIALGQMMGVDISKPDAMTPTQAIAAGLAPELVDAYAQKFSGAAKLVNDDGSLARRIFSCPP